MEIPETTTIMVTRDVWNILSILKIETRARSINDVLREILRPYIESKKYRGL